MTEHLPYRPCVGLTIFNTEGKVFIGQRLDNPGAWQMPQGGIDDGEELEAAIFREMMEEIGSQNAEIIGMMDEWLHYDLPHHLQGRLWGGQYRGQKQKWIALKFLGDDADIDIQHFSQPEFDNWKWVNLDEVLTFAVPFKRDVYTRVIDAFRPYADGLKHGQ